MKSGRIKEKSTKIGEYREFNRQGKEERGMGLTKGFRRDKQEKYEADNVGKNNVEQ